MGDRERKEKSDGGARKVLGFKTRNWSFLYHQPGATSAESDLQYQFLEALRENQTRKPTDQRWHCLGGADQPLYAQLTDGNRHP